MYACLWKMIQAIFEHKNAVLYVHTGPGIVRHLCMVNLDKDAFIPGL